MKRAQLCSFMLWNSLVGQIGTIDIEVMGIRRGDEPSYGSDRLREEEKSLSWMTLTLSYV